MDYNFVSSQALALFEGIEEGSFDGKVLADITSLQRHLISLMALTKLAAGDIVAKAIFLNYLDVFSSKYYKLSPKGILRNAMRELLVSNGGTELRSDVVDAVANLAKTIEEMLGESVIVTSENFDEEFYLDSNPDVRQGILCQTVNSGFEHFNIFGVSEGRRMRLHARR